MRTIIAADKLERTAWFTAATVPRRTGVYERRAPAGPYACWDGKRWRADADTPAAAALREAASANQHAAWRGVATAAPAACVTCRGHTVVDRGIDVESGADLIAECPDC